MTVPECKAKLKEFGLSTSGVRAELISRLESAYCTSGALIPEPWFFEDVLQSGRLKLFRLSLFMLQGNNFLESFHHAQRPLPPVLSLILCLMSLKFLIVGAEVIVLALPVLSHQKQ